MTTKSPLDWVHPAASAAHETISVKRSATSAEREAIARDLDILACKRLDVRYSITAKGKSGHLLVKGAIEADVAQACVVTLEPVPQQISETFEIELVPEGAEEPELPEGEQEILAMPDVEPYREGRIEAGRIVVEILASALEPYPRKDGAEFDWTDPKGEVAKENPFAVLAKLKK